MMSVAVQSFHAPAAATRTAEMAKTSTRHHRTPEAQGTEARSENASRSGRHALMQALSDALGASMPSAQTDSPAAGEAVAAGSPPSAGEQKQALHEFIHELFGALRPGAGEDGAPGHPGRGFAWGRTTSGDLAQRLEALALSVKGTAMRPAPAEPPNSTPSSTDAVITPLPPAAPVAAGAGTDSPLLTAFERLAAMPSGAGTGDAALSPADRLAALLHQLAQALQPAVSSEVPTAGSLIDLSA